MPYRKQRDDGSSDSADSGIIGDLVQQFADPFACLRELVQNAIDADSTEIRVRVDFLDQSEVRISVRDDGEGMNAQILEDQLFVLFRSGKEGLKDKIGKFGVGFVSVFALKPTEVVITTSRGEGTTWVSHLDPAHHYEIFEQAGGSSSGTTVALRVPFDGDAAQFAADARASLTTWCRHASLPIHFTVASVSDESLNTTTRIDRPLDLPGAWCLVQEDVEGTRVLVGIRQISGGAFFNHGLMLTETQEVPELAGLTFKVQDSRLHHTMSRDDVRRDRAYEAAVRRVGEVARRALVPAMLDALDALDAKSFCDRLPSAERALPGLGLPASLIRFPTLHDGSTRPIPQTATHAAKASALTRALERERQLTVFDGVGPLDAVLRARIGPPADELFSLCSEVAPGPSDLVLIDALLDHLDRVLRRPAGALFVSIEGLRVLDPFVAAAPGLIEGTSSGNPFRLMLRSPVLLNVQDPVVASAREAAHHDPWLAASVLARQVLVHFGQWNEERDQAWVQRALEGLE